MAKIIGRKIKEQKNKPESREIDASGQVLGRLASQIAIILRGKDKVSFKPHLEGKILLLVKNAAKLKITGKKLTQKIYRHYSGYPGGLKEKKMSEVFLKNPAAVLKRAVWNMLPKNKLRKPAMKRLKIVN